MNLFTNNCLWKLQYIFFTSQGHGEYTEIGDEKEFFTVCNKSENVVCHFYKSDTPRCAIVDMHLKLLAKKHIETRFVKLDVERAPFLTGTLIKLLYMVW